MRTALVLFLLIFCSNGQTDLFDSPYDTTMWNCFDLRIRINLSGSLELTTEFENKTAYVRDETFCTEEQRLDTVFVHTNDFEQCPLQMCSIDGVPF